MRSSSTAVSSRDDIYCAAVVDDVLVIKNVVLSYVELLDRGDLDGLANVFARARVRIHGSATELRGAAAYREFIEQGVQFYDGVPSTKHVISNLIVEIEDDRRTATARSYYTAFQARPELPLQPILAGRFHDRLERDGDSWYIVERVIFADLIGDLRFHVKGSQPS
jgi:SnoaL-like domain